MTIKKCEKCGTENPSNATFCSECGETLPKVKTNPINKGVSYWKRQNKGFKILTGFLGCCIGAFIILMIIAAVFPTTSLSLENTTANIDNQTTEYILIGHTEPNTTVKLSSKSLNLNGVEITPESNGTFEYKLEIPTNTSDVDVVVTAKVPNKSENRATATIKRPSITSNSTKTTSSNQVFENQYIKFEYPKDWTVVENDKNGKMHLDITTPHSSNAALYAYPLTDWVSNHPGVDTTLHNVAMTELNESGHQAALNKITVSGVEGWESVPLSYDKINLAYYEMYVAKGDVFYYLNIPTKDYNADKDGINLIVSTIQLK